MTTNKSEQLLAKTPEQIAYDIVGEHERYVYKDTGAGFDYSYKLINAIATAIRQERNAAETECDAVQPEREAKVQEKRWPSNAELMDEFQRAYELHLNHAADIWDHAVDWLKSRVLGERE